MFLRFLLTVIFSTLLVTSASADRDKSTREFPLPNIGQLQLQMPTEWKDLVRQPEQGLPPTITLVPAQGNSFEVLITPFWAVHPGIVVPEPEEIRKIVRQTADEAKSQAIEQVIPLKEIAGTSGIGYYFSATDRAPKPGEFKYLTQGTLRVGELALMFTVLTNDGGEMALADAMEMLKGAKHVARRAP